MLTGKELGAAISAAIDKKIAAGGAKSNAEIARHFGIKPPSIYDWINRGTITKDKLPKIWDYFSDVVGLDHWGLDGSGEWPFSSVPKAAYDQLPSDEKIAIEGIIQRRCEDHNIAISPIATAPKTAA